MRICSYEDPRSSWTHPSCLGSLSFISPIDCATNLGLACPRATSSWWMRFTNEECLVLDEISSNVASICQSRWLNGVWSIEQTFLSLRLFKIVYNIWHIGIYWILWVSVISYWYLGICLMIPFEDKLYLLSIRYYLLNVWANHVRETHSSSRSWWRGHGSRHHRRCHKFLWLSAWLASVRQCPRSLCLSCLLKLALLSIRKANHS